MRKIPAYLFRLYQPWKKEGTFPLKYNLAKLSLRCSEKQKYSLIGSTINHCEQLGLLGSNFVRSRSEYVDAGTIEYFKFTWWNKMHFISSLFWRNSNIYIINFGVCVSYQKSFVLPSILYSNRLDIQIRTFINTCLFFVSTSFAAFFHLSP